MKSIFYKEAIKLKLPIIAVFTVNIAVCVYLYFRVRVGFVMQEPSALWLDIILKNGFYFDRLTNPIVLSAFALGILQFYVEADRRKFRISCHLPINEIAMVFYMQLFGLICIITLWIIDLIGVLIVSVRFFPYDIIKQVPIVMLYKLFLGTVAYMIGATIALEHAFISKIRIALLLCGIVSFFTVIVYRPSIIHTLIAFATVVISLFFIYYPALNYRAGGN